jgi:hypothetical protein
VTAPPLIILADTGHVSALAIEPSKDGADEVIRRLDRGEVRLAIPFLAVVELANPAFAKVGEVRALLRDVPTLFANPFENVQEEEMALAVARANNLSRRAPRVFSRDMGNWGYSQGVAEATVVDMLDAMIAMPEVRGQLLATAALGARQSMMKRQAKLIQEPLFPLTAELQDHLDIHRVSLPEYGHARNAAEIVAAVGGKAAFPGYQVIDGLATVRMKDTGQKSTGNDIIDEFNAFHSPYATATVLDRATVHRAKMAKLPHVERMTRSLTEVPGILDRVVAGEFVPENHDWSGLDFAR